MLELYHYGDSLCSMKVRFASSKGMDYKSKFVDLMKFENLKDYKSNPNAVVPTIVHDGTAMSNPL